jgi:transcriptional regulator with XRE-family HTH domain
MDVIDALRSARVSRGWDQTELAQRLGTSQSAISFIEGRRRAPRLDTVESWLSATHHRVVIYPSVFADATETALAIDVALDAGNRDRAWRALLDYSDGLAVCPPVECVLLAACAPPVSVEPTWAAALAAVTDWRLRDRALPVPEWVEEPQRSLSSAQPLVISDYDLTPALSDVPEEFQRRNLLVEAGALRSA